MHTQIVLVAGAVAVLLSPARSLSQTFEPASDTVLARLTAQALAANPTLQASQASVTAVVFGCAAAIYNRLVARASTAGVIAPARPATLRA